MKPRSLGWLPPPDVKLRADFQIDAVPVVSERVYSIYERHDSTFSYQMIRNVRYASNITRAAAYNVSTWKRSFALLPVRLEEGGWAWMRPVWKRTVDRSQPYCSIWRRQYTDDPTKDYN